YDVGGRIVGAERPEAARAVAGHVVKQLLAVINARLERMAREIERVVEDELMIMLAAVDGHVGRGADDPAAGPHADAGAKVGREANDRNVIAVTHVLQRRSVAEAVTELTDLTR